MTETRLQHLRETSNLTQEALGNAIGASHDAVSSWERGERYPSHKNGKKLVAFFNAQSLEWLMSNEPENKANSALAVS